MAVELATGYVSIVPSMKGAAGSLSKELGDIGDDAGKTAGGRAGSSFGGAFKAVAAAASAAAIGGLFKSAIEDASNLSETSSKVGVLFGGARDEVDKFAATAAKSFGQTKQQALDAASTFAVFGKGAGLTGKDLSGFSVNLAGLASDLASFSNTSTEDAITAIGAALRGESEPIRSYGVLLDDATLRQEALGLGLIKTTKQALTPQQRVLAAQAAIYKQTSDAQGDFARTSGGLANQQRILSATLANGRAELGSKLLPVVTQVVTFLNGQALPAFTKVSTLVKDTLAPAFRFVADAVKAFVLGIQGAPTEVGGLIEKIGHFGGVVRGAFQFATDAVRLFIGAFTGKGADTNLATKYINPIIDAAATAREVFDAIRAAIPPVIAWVRDFASAVAAYLYPKLVAVGEYLGRVLPPILSAIGTFITTRVVPALQQVAAFIRENALPALQALGAWLVENLGPAFSQLADTFQQKVIPGLRAVGDFIVNTVLPILGQLAQFFVEHILPAVGKVVGFLLQNLLPVLIQVVGFVIGDVLPAVLRIVAAIADFLVPIILAVAGFITDVLVPAFLAVASFITDHVIPVVLDITGFLVGLIATIVEVVSEIGQKIAVVVGFVIDLPGKIADAAVNLWEGLKNGLEAVINWIKDKLDTILGPLDEVLSKVPGSGGVFDGGLIGRIRGKAVGGPVDPFGTYLVGEAGPEIIRMGSKGGTVIPNHELSVAPGGRREYHLHYAGAAPANVMEQFARAERLDSMAVA